MDNLFLSLGIQKCISFPAFTFYHISQSELGPEKERLVAQNLVQGQARIGAEDPQAGPCSARSRSIRNFCRTWCNVDSLT